MGETVADKLRPQPLPLIEIDKPTLTINFKVNDSPFAGKEGKYVNARHLWQRLQKELQTNVSILVERTNKADEFIVKGRGELQLSILIENMRREGFEFQVSKPKVIFRELNGKKTEPVEIAIIDVSNEFVGTVIEMLGTRKGKMLNMVAGSDGYTRLEYKIPSRGLIGFRNEFITETRGTGILNHSFYEYEYFTGEIERKTRGVLVAMQKGEATGYSLNSFQPRGTLFINPGTKVYEGMIVGEHSRENDLVINVCKGKKLTNVRAAGSDDAIKLNPPRQFSLEQAMEYIEEDELLEVTPQNMRMRKKILKTADRKRNRKN